MTEGFEIIDRWQSRCARQGVPAVTLYTRPLRLVMLLAQTPPRHVLPGVTLEELRRMLTGATPPDQPVALVAFHKRLEMIYARAYVVADDADLLARQVFDLMGETMTAFITEGVPRA